MGACRGREPLLPLLGTMARCKQLLLSQCVDLSVDQALPPGNLPPTSGSILCHVYVEIERGEVVNPLLMF